MCFRSKQTLNGGACFFATVFMIAGPAAASGDADRGADAGTRRYGGSAGGVAIGEGAGGITDRVWVTAPPNYSFVVERERGSFLDCGEGQDVRVVDRDGRDMTPLQCGVTLTETVIIPAAATSARVTIHF